MKGLWDHGILQKILLVGILIIFLGIAPRPHDVQTSLIEVHRAQDHHQPLEVAVNLALIARQQPWRVDLWETAGQYALAGADVQLAVENFTQAAALGQLSAKGYLAWGDLTYQLGNAYTALQIWEIAGEQGIPEYEILTRKTDLHRAEQNHNALIEDLKALISGQWADVNRQPSEIAALQRELGLLLAVYDPAAAPPYLLQAADASSQPEPDLRELSFAIQLALPQDDPAYTLMVAGQELAAQANWEMARIAFENAVDLRPDYAEAWAYLGGALQKLKYRQKGFAALQTAVELDPESVAAHTFLGIYYQQQGDLESALDHMNTAARFEHRNPALMVDIGNLLAAMGNLERGEAYLRRAMDLVPGDPTYVRAFVEFCIRYNLDLRETALPAARAAVMVHAGDPASLDVLGQVLFRLNDLLNAERFFLRALENDPEYAPAHLHLGLVYALQAGKQAISRYHLSRAIELAPNSATADHARRILESP